MLLSTFHLWWQYFFSLSSCLVIFFLLFFLLARQGLMFLFRSSLRKSSSSYPLSVPNRFGRLILFLIVTLSMVFRANFWSWWLARQQVMANGLPRLSTIIFRFSPFILCFPVYPTHLLPPFLTWHRWHQGRNSANEVSSFYWLYALIPQRFSWACLA